jgi:hypothetical protein
VGAGAGASFGDWARKAAVFGSQTDCGLRNGVRGFKNRD